MGQSEMMEVGTIEVLLVLDKGPADTLFHKGHIVKGHIPQPHPRNIYSSLCCYGCTTVVTGLRDAGVPVCLQDFSFLFSQR